MQDWIKRCLPYIEGAICYFLLLFSFYYNLISFNLILILSLLLSSIFGLFYGIKGLFISLAGIGLCLLLRLTQISSIVMFKSIFLSTETFFLILANLINPIIVGFWGQKRISEEENMQSFVNSIRNRFGFVLSELISIEKAYQEVFQKSFGLITKPTFFYHEMRALIHEIKEIDELFLEVFLKLERYFDIGGGIVYKKDQNGYKEVVRFGLSSLPEEFKESDVPDWLYLAQTENEVVVPNSIKIGIIAAAPVDGYVMVIERMKYTYSMDNVIKDIGKVAFCVRLFLEKRFEIERLKPYSIHPKIIVWREDKAKKLLPERIRICQRWNIPFAVGKLTFSDHLSLIRGVETIYKNIRETDEMFQIGNDLIVVFFMAKDFPTVRKILKDRIGVEFKPYEI